MERKKLILFVIVLVVVILLLVTIFSGYFNGDGDRVVLLDEENKKLTPISGLSKIISVNDEEVRYVNIKWEVLSFVNHSGNSSADEGLTVKDLPILVSVRKKESDNITLTHIFNNVSYKGETDIRVNPGNSGSWLVNFHNVNSYHDVFVKVSMVKVIKN